MTTDVRTPKARQILEAAAELFYAHGIHAVGVDTIVDRAGVSKKTLYERFGSKDQLVAAYLAERDARWRSSLEGHLQCAGPRPADQVSAVFRASASWAERHGAKGCGMINAHAEISDPEHPAYATIVGQKSWMLELFRSRVAEVRPDVAAELAEELMLLHEGAVVCAGMGTVADSFSRAATAARRLVDEAPAR